MNTNNGNISFFCNGQLYKAVLIRQSVTGESLGYQVMKADNQGRLLDIYDRFLYPTPYKAVNAFQERI